VEHFRAQFVFPSAAAICCPLKSQVVDLIGSSKVWELRQYFFQDYLITAVVVGRPEGSPHRVINEHCPGWGDLAHDIQRRARYQSRNALGFNRVRDETDGLVTERSVGDEQRQINFELGQFASDDRRQLPFNFLLEPDSTHHGHVKGRE
jgi:hypothetical protein